ncbi:hypothetical protein [Foetidibacter luteolus]|uniref:hypothetical protein n=1 Tax=Foetidibacter luteolus TaxID=2608880 RepID=UPI00129BB341|nr:hypothetical protein [Foetidibacter luteolus]
MKHILTILLTIVIILTGIFLPFIHGAYDYFAVGLSYIFQFGIFASLPLVPTGLIWLILNVTNRQNERTVKYPLYLRRAIFIIAIIIGLASALGAFASDNRFSAMAILGIGICLFLVRKKVNLRPIPNGFIPYYLFVIPLAVISIRLAYFESAKDKSTDFVIKQSEQLIQDIEAYKRTNGHYPTSLLSTIEDYHTGVSGISRFHYELRGNAYNLYFVQTSNMLGTEEIVMYNKLDKQEMTVHNQDLLRKPYDLIIHGHHKVQQLPQKHWKIFYFD